MMLSHILLALCLITTTKSQFHPDCTTPDALSKRRCCPVYIDGSECGSSSGRGSCQRSQLKDSTISDTRCNWPYQQYDEVCSCNGNYYGADCGDCKPFYHGPTCSEYKPCLRKEARELTAAEKKQLVDAICLAKTTISTSCVAQTGGTLGDASTYTYEKASEYDCIVATHANSAMDIKEGEGFLTADLMHRGPAFCSAHRCLLLTYERMLQRVSGNSSLCIPYWDWSMDGNTCAVCTPDLMGSVGIDGRIQAPSCFANWTTYCEDSTSHTFCKNKKNPPPVTRAPGRKSWPTKTEVDNSVNKWDTYDSGDMDETATQSSRNCIEGFSNPATGEADGSSYMHNKVHGEVGGCMNWLQCSSNDPIFYMHHCNVDRICAMWQWTHCKTSADYPSDGTPPCQGPNNGVYPTMPPRTMKDCMRTPAEWGYTYSNVKTWPKQTCSGNPQPAASPITTTTTKTSPTTTTKTSPTTSPTTRTTTRSTTISTSTKVCGLLCLLGK